MQGKIFGVKALSLSAAALLSVALSAPARAGGDDEAMMAFLKKNDCTKCHAMDKTKKGPSYKKIASKYKGKADAEDKLMKHLTTGPKVKLEDGTEEEHKAPEVSKAEIKNLIHWILGL